MVIKMSTRSLASKVPSNRTRIFVRASNGTLVLSNSVVAVQKTVENNNAAGKEILDDDRIVGDSVNVLVTPKNEENESEGDTSVCKASGSSNDEELTSLTWLQNTNLLQSIHFSTSAAKKSTTNDKKNTKPDGICKNSSLEESETESSWDGSNLSYSDATVLPSQVMFPQTMEGEEEPKAPLMKPPHSFSTLIFLSIESSSSKALPVRDIYAWITKHFPYYCFAPVGWKNSVRHNLSLNKSFCKVERGPNVGKGSLWMVDPLHRPQLLQSVRTSSKSLCKVPYVKSEILQQLMDETKLVQVKTEPIQESRESVVLVTPAAVTRPNMPDPKLFPYLSRRLAFDVSQNEGPDVDAATAMLALGQSHTIFNPSHHPLIYPATTASHNKYFHANEQQKEEDSDSADEMSPATKASKVSPAEDHTYSFSPRTGKLVTGSPVGASTGKKPHFSSFQIETKSKRRLHDDVVLDAAEFVSEVEVKTLREERAAKVSKTVVRAKEKSKSKRGRGRWR